MTLSRQAGLLTILWLFAACSSVGPAPAPTPDTGLVHDPGAAVDPGTSVDPGGAVDQGPFDPGQPDSADAPDLGFDEGAPDIPPPQDFGPPPDNEEGLALGDLRIMVAESPPSLRVLDAEGRVLFASAPGILELARISRRESWQQGYYGVARQEISKTGFESGRADLSSGSGRAELLIGPSRGVPALRLVIAPSATGLLLEAELLQSYPEDKAPNELRFRFRCGPGDGYYGLGGQSDAAEHRGQTVPIRVTEQGKDPDLVEAEASPVGHRYDAYFPLPYVLVARPAPDPRAHGLILDTVRRSRFLLCSEDPGVMEIQAAIPPAAAAAAPPEEGSGEGTFPPPAPGAPGAGPIVRPRVRLWLLAGPTPKDVVGQYTELLGRARPLPRWAFGPWIAFQGEPDEVREELETLVRENIPATAIWEQGWRDLSHPALPTLVERAHDLGLAVLTYFSTFIDEQEVSNPAAALAAGYAAQTGDGEPYLFTRATFESAITDLTNPGARQWLGNRLRRALSLGIDGWTADHGEWVAPDMHFSDGRTGESYANTYAVDWQRLNDEVLSSFVPEPPPEARPAPEPHDEPAAAPPPGGDEGAQAGDLPDAGSSDGDAGGAGEDAGTDPGTDADPGADTSTPPEPEIIEPLVLTRSGYLGSNRHARVVWAGEQNTSFELLDGLPSVIPYGTSLGLAGVSAFGHDIAGYTGGLAPPSTRELYMRWTELGAFSPVMRTSRGLLPDQNWNWDRDKDTVEHFRDHARVHLRLLPYIEALHAEAVRTGVPAMRHLLLEFPGWEGAKDAHYEFMLGPALLVAPVIEAGSLERSVSLPPGRWIHFDTGDTWRGGRSALVPAELGHIPVFLREGAIVPLLGREVRTVIRAPAAPERTPASDSEKEFLELRVVAGARASLELADGTHVLLLPAKEDLREAGLKLSLDGADLEPCSLGMSPRKDDCFAQASGGNILLVGRTGPGSVILGGDATKSDPMGLEILGGPASRRYVVRLYRAQE